MSDPYSGREQTKAKHFILKHYLQELAFKVLHGWDIAYIDGFSGPWESRTEDFSDTSFMIAVEVLKDAQQRIFETTGQRRKIRCFFSESNPEAYERLAVAVARYHNPADGFEVITYCGKFEDAVPQINTAIGSAFPLIFIDPTGWSGYPFEKIRSLFASPKCEVLINFMYDFVNRFAASHDPNIVASLDPILGGPGWRDRLDKTLPLGLAVERLFRETLKREGNFTYVISTKIDKRTSDRPHFYIAYGTKSRAGLIAFRQTEYDALREYARSRGTAIERERESCKGLPLFEGLHADIHEESIEEIIKDQMRLATQEIRIMLSGTPGLRFSTVVDTILQSYMLRETNVKDICVQLARDGFLENTWGGGNRKPKDEDLIKAMEA